MGKLYNYKKEKKMFKEEIEKISNDKYKITVTIEKRKYSFEAKKIYKTNPKNLLPVEVQNRAKLISSPSKTLSNIDKQKFTTQGEWIFSITPPPAKKARSRSRIKKPSTNSSNNVIIDNKAKTLTEE